MDGCCNLISYTWLSNKQGCEAQGKREGAGNVPSLSTFACIFSFIFSILDIETPKNTKTLGRDNDE
jgi:hypothetical protein